MKCALSVIVVFAMDNVDIDVVKLRPLLCQRQPAFTFKAQFDCPRFSALSQGTEESYLTVFLVYKFTCNVQL